MIQKPTTFADAMPFSSGDQHIINDSFVDKIEKAILTDKVENFDEFIKDDLKFDVYAKGFNTFPPAHLKPIERPTPPSPKFSFIATIPEKIELGDEPISIQIETDATSYDGEIAEATIAHYNRTLDKITPLVVGNTTIVFTAEKDGEQRTFEYQINVVDENPNDTYVPEPPVTPTPDNGDEPNFTDEELALTMLNRARYEDLKEFMVEWGALNGQNDEAQIKAMLYQQTRQAITQAQSKDPCPTLRAMDFDTLKSACKWLENMYSLMGATQADGTNPFAWHEEVPTLTSSNSMQQQTYDKLNPILSKHFVIPMKSKEDYIYNHFLTSLGSPGSQSPANSAMATEYYIAVAYQSAQYFRTELASVDITKFNTYPYTAYITQQPSYATKTEDEKRELCYFYLAQVIMSSAMNPSPSQDKITREQVVAEIKAIKSEDEILQAVADEFYNASVEKNQILTEANFNQLEATYQIDQTPAGIGSLAYVLAALYVLAGKNNDFILGALQTSLSRHLQRDTTARDNINIYNKIKVKFAQKEVIDKCVNFISVEQGFIYSQESIANYPYDKSWYRWNGDGETIAERIESFGVYMFNASKITKIVKQIPEIFWEHRTLVNTGEQELYIAKEIDKIINAKHQG